MENENTTLNSGYPDRVKPGAFTADKHDTAMAILSFLTAVICVLWGIKGILAFGWTVTFAFYFVCCTIYLSRDGGRPSAFAIVCGVLSLMMAFVFVITSNYLVLFFGLIDMIMLASVFFSSLSGKNLPSGELGFIGFIFEYLLRSVSFVPKAFMGLFTGNDGKKSSTSKALLGLLTALPVLCVVIPVLKESDAAFEGLIDNVFTDAGTAAAEIAGIIFLAPLLIAYPVSLRKCAGNEENEKQSAGFDTVFISAFLSAISICYLIYLFSQLAYFFSAFSGILPENYEFSYAEYARRGFFEICGIAAINLIIVFSVICFSKKKEKKIPVILRILGTFICLFTVLLICTAVSKMVMYVNNYGMTMMRICTSVFLIVTGLIFAALILRLFSEKVKVVRFALILSSAALLMLGMGNVNSRIASYNYNAFVTEKLSSIDVSYLGELGEEGAEYLIKLTDCGDRETEAAACDYISSLVQELYDGEWVDETVQRENTDVWIQRYKQGERKYTAFWELSLPRLGAYKALEEYLSQNPDFFDKCMTFSSEIIEEEIFEEF